MTTIYASLLIACPSQAVFEYIIRPQNGPTYIPYLKKIDSLNPSHSGIGQLFNWRYTMSGIEMKGEAEVIEYVPQKRYMLSTTGDIASTWAFVLEEKYERTKVTVTIIYEISSTIVMHVLDSVTLDRFNQEILEDALENLRAQLEA